MSGQTSALGILKKAFSFPVLMGAMLVAGVFAPLRDFILDPDVWWHIKLGDTILRTHHWPEGDPFSFTVPGTPWMAYEWLGDVLLAAAHHAGGLQAMLALDVTLGAGIVLALYVLSTIRTGNSKAAFVTCAVLALLAEVSFSLRPQMVGYLFLVLTLIALERFRQGKPRGLWFLPLLFLVWINTHGSFIIGLGVMGTYWASGLAAFRVGDLEARRWAPGERLRLELVLLLSLIALTITPYGTRLAVYPFHVASSLPLNVADVLEWQSMPFNLLPGRLFLALLLGFLIAQIALRATWRLEEMALFLGGAWMACLHARFLLIFVPFFAPLLAVLVARWVPPYDQAKDKYALNTVLTALILAGIVRFFPSRAALAQAVAEKFPVEAVEYLQRHPVPEPMYDQYGYGGYLIWARWPEHKVFIDGRGDLYEREGAFADYMYIAQVKPGALAVLDGYRIRSCLLLRDEPLATLLTSLPKEWQEVYTDKLSVLFVRRSTGPIAGSSPGRATASLWLGGPVPGGR
jgi:hypothetical protein